MDFSLRATDLTELMDEPGNDPREIRKALIFLRRLNRIGGSHRVLRREVRRLNPGDTSSNRVRVLDIGTGGGDVPAALNGTGAGTGTLAVGLDTNPAVLAQARDLYPRVSLVRADAFHLPFPDRSFDTVVSHLFFHHLDEEECVTLLREMSRVGKSVVIMDLARSRWLYLVVTLLGWFSGSRLSRHDGPVSVRRSYTPDEVRRICSRAGLDADVQRHPFWRWTAVSRG